MKRFIHIGVLAVFLMAATSAFCDNVTLVVYNNGSGPVTTFSFFFDSYSTAGGWGYHQSLGGNLHYVSGVQGTLNPGATVTYSCQAGEHADSPVYTNCNSATVKNFYITYYW